MNSELKTILLRGPITVAGICDELGQSKSKVLKLLKEDQAAIHVRKEEGQNLYWLPQLAEGDDFEASEAELAAQAPRQEIQERAAATNPPTETSAASGPNGGAETCPLCHAEADQVQAGPEGTYLGAARTCSACKKTYNVFSKEEVKMAKAPKEGTKRAAPLNPQYKINAKIAGAEAAGGKLVYQRDGRTWLLTKRGVEPKQMTATEFSVETVESIQKYLGFTPPPAAPKAEKPAKASKSSGGSKASKSTKTSKATGSGGKAPKGNAAAQEEKVDELVG